MLGRMFNSVGQNPSDQELMEMLGEVDRSGNFMMSFGEFISLMNRKSRETENEEEVLEAFKLFARDKDGLIKFENLRMVIDDIEAFLPETVQLKRVTDDEIIEMIKEVSLETDKAVNAEDFISKFGSL
jgi:Ca2+-binding EF-hand superfamily protein